VAKMADSSSVSNLTLVGNKLFFTSWSQKDTIDIWVTEGSLNSSKVLKKFPNYSNIMGADPMFFNNFNNILIFTALESYSIDKYGNSTLNPYLWRSDGTNSGTIKLKKLSTWFYLDDDYPNTWGGKYVVLDNKLLFAATAPDTLNYELWSTDGTITGTIKVCEINKNIELHEPYWAYNRSSFPTSLTKMGNKVYFAANDGIHGQELWVTDGTAAGTHLVKDIFAGDTSSMSYYYHQEEFVASNNKLFFTVDFARRLWVSDGTESGTKEIKKFNYTTYSKNNGIFESNLIDISGTLYFEVHYWNYSNLANDSIVLWKSDGTENGTSKVFNLNKMDVSSFVNYKSNLFFLNKKKENYELWKTDGTFKNTVKISEFKIPETLKSKLYVFNDSIYFTALDSNNVLKIWKSDGTSIGTTPVKYWDETKFTSISDLVPFNEGIYFSANKNNNITALYKYVNRIQPFTNIDAKKKQSKLSINPNPVRNNLKVVLPHSRQNGLFTIYNASGTLIKSIAIAPGQTNINCDISAFKNGFYIVSFSGGQFTHYDKFLKE
jgi:ELWxxDGT repeat protein